MVISLDMMDGAEYGWLRLRPNHCEVIRCQLMVMDITFRINIFSSVFTKEYLQNIHRIRGKRFLT